MRRKLLFWIMAALLFNACSQDEFMEINEGQEVQNSLKVALESPLITFSWNTETRFMANGKYEKAIAMNLENEIFIDWGDGTGDLFTELDSEAYGYCFYHHYATEGNYTVRIFGEENAIIQFNNDNMWSGDQFREYSMSKVDLSNCRSLKYLYLNRTVDASGILDLRNNYNLERAYCSENNYTRFLANGSKLEIVCCQKNRFPYLDFIVGFTKLKLLDTRYSPECEAIYLLRGVSTTVLKDDNTILEYWL